MVRQTFFLRSIFVVLGEGQPFFWSDLSFDRSTGIRFVTDVRREFIQLEILFADGVCRVFVLEILRHENREEEREAEQGERVLYSNQLLFRLCQTSNLIEGCLHLLVKLPFDAIDDIHFLHQ